MVTNKRDFGRTLEYMIKDTNRSLNRVIDDTTRSLKNLGLKDPHFPRDGADAKAELLTVIEGVQKEEANGAFGREIHQAEQIAEGEGVGFDEKNMETELGKALNTAHKLISDVSPREFERAGENFARDLRHIF